MKIENIIKNSTELLKARRVLTDLAHDVEHHLKTGVLEAEDITDALHELDSHICEVLAFFTRGGE